MSKQDKFHTCVFISVLLVRKSYFLRYVVAGLCRFWFVDLSMTCGGQENCLISGVPGRLSFLATPFAAII
jgi:hypothetical protein